MVVTTGSIGLTIGVGLAAVAVGLFPLANLANLILSLSSGGLFFVKRFVMFITATLHGLYYSESALPANASPRPL